MKRFYARQWRGNNRYDAGLLSQLNTAIATRPAYATFKARTNPGNRDPLP
jgi:hypothetical protein